MSIREPVIKQCINQYPGNTPSSASLPRISASPTKREGDEVSEAEDYDLKCAKKRQNHF
jgi:hypothetical protein